MPWIAMLIGIGLGLMVGFQFGRGATFERSLIKGLWTNLFVVLAIFGLACLLKMESFGFAMAVGVGIVAAVIGRIQLMLWWMPRSLRATSLAARPGESEPCIGYIDGKWVLSYTDGTVIRYDKNGSVSEIDFANASDWKLEPSSSKADEPKPDDRRLM